MRSNVYTNKDGEVVYIHAFGKEDKITLDDVANVVKLRSVIDWTGEELATASTVFLAVVVSS